MSEYLSIQGGQPLRGEFAVAGAKNAALKMLVAAILTPEEVVLENIPRIADVEYMIESLRFLGVQVDWLAKESVSIRAHQIKTYALPPELAKKTKASFLFFGALLGRFGKAAMPDPGGDQIGHRPVERHVGGFIRLGARIQRRKGFYQAKDTGIIGGEHVFRKSSHTGTENLILAATLGKSRTIIKNAAQEPEIDNLIGMLDAMGAKITRIEPRTIEVIGVRELKGTQWRIMPDRIEAATVAIMAAVTRGEVFLAGAPVAEMTAFLSKFEQAGGRYRASSNGLQVWIDEKTIFKTVSIITKPHPGFMSDWGPPFTILMALAEGESILHETIFPNRFAYVRELKKMGAEIQFFNPPVDDFDSTYNFNEESNRPEYFHAIRVFGPTPLVGTKLLASDIRAGASLVTAALCAKGQSEIHGLEHLDRGYQNLTAQLQALGAKIKRVQAEA